MPTASLLSNRAFEPPSAAVLRADGGSVVPVHRQTSDIVAAMRASLVFEHDQTDALRARTASASPEFHRAKGKHGQVHRPQHILHRINRGTPHDLPDNQENGAGEEDEHAG